MNLKKIQDYIERYKIYLKSPKAENELYKWETLKIFQANWKTEADDLAAMYNASLTNDTSRRQWVDNDFYPKEMMLKFLQTEPEYVRLAFRDLFNDDKGIEGRVNRFIFYCDELLGIYKDKNPKAKENDHYHNPEVVFMYLTYKFPKKYTFYSFLKFKHFLESVDAKNISASHDFERFVKVTKTINIFLNKDEEVQMLLQERLKENHYQEDNVLAVHELIGV